MPTITAMSHDESEHLRPEPDAAPAAAQPPSTEGRPLGTLLPLLLAAVLAVVLGFGVSWLGSGDTTATTGATGTADRAAGEPDATRIPRLQAAAEELTGTTLPGPVSVSRLDANELKELVGRLMDEDPDPMLSTGYNDLFHLMGVLAPGANLETIIRDGLVDQAAGLYDPKTDRLYLVQRAGADVTDSIVVHEIVHAIQDVKYPLESLMKSRTGDQDGTSAIQAVIEGEATEVQVRYLLDQGAAGILGELSGSLNQLSGTQFNLPPYLQRSLEFPYTQGQSFIEALRADGGQAAVDRAYRNPPRTTLAIMEPQRYIDGQDGSVSLPAAAPPAQGQRVLTATFGASEVWALTGDHSLALTWRAGRATVDRSGDEGTLTLTIATSDPEGLSTALEKVLPDTTEVTIERSVVTAVNRQRLDTPGG